MIGEARIDRATWSRLLLPLPGEAPRPTAGRAGRPIPRDGRRIVSDRPPVSARERWIGPALGVLLTIHVASDVLRPKFVPVNAGSEVMEHVANPIVPVLHFLAVFLLAIPVGWACFVGRCDLRRSSKFVVLACGIVAIATASLFQVRGYQPLIYLAMLVMVMACASVFVATQYGAERGVRVMLAWTAAGCGLALVVAIGLNEYAYGRLASRAGPTHWGMVAMVCFCLAPCLDRPRWRVGLMALSLLALLLTSARGATLATLVAGITMMFIHVRRTAPGERRNIYAGLVLACLCLPLVIPVLADDVFQVNDPGRGLSSGATGRSAAWAQAWNLFLTHPVLGVGYRQHEQYITVASSAHEAYLIVLAELGPLGLALYLILLFGGLGILIRRACLGGGRVPLVGSAYLAAYAVIGLTEPYALATGVIAPVLMILITAVAWSDPLAGFPVNRKPLGGRRRHGS